MIPLLPFLHSVPLPRPSLIRSYFRRISTTPQLRQQQAHIDTPTVHFQPAQPSEVIPYHVDRTPSKQLPVYHIAKSGNVKKTRVRKISGDIARLRDDLQRVLGLREDQIKINQLTKHIIIKGWKKVEIAKFLQERQF